MIFEILKISIQLTFSWVHILQWQPAKRFSLGKNSKKQDTHMYTNLTLTTSLLLCNNITLPNLMVDFDITLSNVNLKGRLPEENRSCEKW